MKSLKLILLFIIIMSVSCNETFTAKKKVEVIAKSNKKILVRDLTIKRHYTIYHPMLSTQVEKGDVITLYIEYSSKYLYLRNWINLQNKTWSIVFFEIEERE